MWRPSRLSFFPSPFSLFDFLSLFCHLVVSLFLYFICSRLEQRPGREQPKDEKGDSEPKNDRKRHAEKKIAAVFSIAVAFFVFLRPCSFLDLLSHLRFPPSLSLSPSLPLPLSPTLSHRHQTAKKKQSVKDLPIVQDGPPPGGFPAVRYARRIPSTGPAGVTLFAVGAAVMAFGFYRVGQGNKHRREIRHEKIARRNALYPVLQAEEDRSWVARKEAAVEKEAALMRGVEGWEAGKSVYSPGARWVPPAAPYGSWGASG